MSQQVEQLLTQLDQETDLLALETVVQPWSHAVGRRTLMSVVPTVTAQYALTTLPCVCSADGQYQRRRAAQVLTSMGSVTYQRAYYVCLACHQGWCPLDAQLGWCAGSVSRILQEHIAVVAAQLPFAQTADVLHRLWGIPLSATTCQSIAEQVGPWLHAHASEGVGEPLGDTV